MVQCHSRSVSETGGLWGARVPCLAVAACLATAWLVAGCGCAGQSSEGGIAWKPLAPAQGSDGPLFRKLKPEETGIEFTNYLFENHVTNYILNGSGVCVGDYDGDGRPDIYMVSLDGPNRLYRQVGDLKFEDVTDKAGVDGGGAWGTGASFADVDNDGDLDLYVCNLNSADNLFINQGDGTFKEAASAAGLGNEGASMMAAFADYDRDGDLDLYLLTNRVYGMVDELPRDKVIWVDGKPLQNPDYRDQYFVMGDQVLEAGQADFLYRNDGNGKFTDVTEEAGIAGHDMGLSATWWDYNADGWIDLYVGNDFMTPDHLYRNNGDGTFTDVIDSIVPHTTWYSMGADFGDINGDGMADFMIADMSSTTHYKEKTAMGGMSGSKWFLESAEPRQYMRNAVYLNTGGERFMEVAYLAGIASTDWTWTVRLEDLDNDGLVDLFTTNGMAKNALDSDLRKEAQELIEQGLQQRANILMRESPPLLEANMAFRNMGDLNFENVSAEWGLDLFGVTHGAVIADLDRDGDLDIVINNLNERATLYRNEGTAGHRVLVRLEGTESNRFGVGAKVTIHTRAGVQVRQLTLARGYMSASEPVIHFGLGKESKIQRLSVEWPSGARQTFEGLKADRFYTITEPRGSFKFAAPPQAPEGQFEDYTAASGLNFTHAERVFDDYAREPLLPSRLSQLGPGLAWGDADGDGDEDLYVGGAAGQAGALFLNNGDGTFKKASGGPWAADSASEDMAPLWFDADGDGDQDLYVVSGGVECDPGDPVLRDRLYINDGSGSFTRAPGGTLPDVADSGSVVAACDFDRDGDLDLFVGGRVIPGKYPLTPNSRLLRNEGGRFLDVTDETAAGLMRAGLVTGAVWSDTDGDGWTDLLLTVEWGPVKVFRNIRGELSEATEEAGLAGYTGWWNGIAAGDVDGDGDIDYVVTNFGLNTKYHATEAVPATLYLADFDRDGDYDLVEAMYEDGEEFPIRGRSCSSGAMPFVAEKFDTYKAFAKATLDEVYTPTDLARAKTFQASYLQSALLINRGDGTFTVSPLPRLAQASPGFGVTITDFDADGRPDIYFVQNFFSPQAETGRMDGGLSLLLRGNGDGTFEPVWPSESGFVVPQDAKGLAVSDMDGDGRPDIAVGTNDGELRVFRNRGVGDRRFLTVRLEGKRGNPTAVGARVTLVMQSGAEQTAEVVAGSGYLSQSTCRLAFGLGKDGRPAKVRVLWPDGQVSEFTSGLDSQTVTLRRP